MGTKNTLPKPPDAALALKVVSAIKWARANLPRIVNRRKRFTKPIPDYLRFLNDGHVEPTDNVAERALRHCVINRKVTLGTRGDTGEGWCERFRWRL